MSTLHAAIVVFVCFTDVDECSDEYPTRVCEHDTSICVNTPGSYHCDCKNGYVDVPTSHTCIGIVIVLLVRDVYMLGGVYFSFSMSEVTAGHFVLPSHLHFSNTILNPEHTMRQKSLFHMLFSHCLNCALQFIWLECC